MIVMVLVISAYASTHQECLLLGTWLLVDIILCEEKIPRVIQLLHLIVDNVSILLMRACHVKVKRGTAKGDTG